VGAFAYHANFILLFCKCSINNKGDFRNKLRTTRIYFISGNNNRLRKII
jgi:hypothetical protein